ncbi:MAG TPA: hypothetical protein VIB82_04870 [Caulobacteraceae bacterium]
MSRLPVSISVLQMTSSGDSTFTFLAAWAGATAAGVEDAGVSPANAAPAIEARKTVAKAVMAVRVMVSSQDCEIDLAPKPFPYASGLGRDKTRHP